MGKNPQNTDRRSFIAKALMGTASIGLLSTTNGMAATFLLPREVEEKAFVPADGANNPMGAPRGVVPGRVAWSHDPLACTWDGVTGTWWEDAHNNQERISKMFSGTLKSIANQKSDKKAWQAIFSHFNQNRGKGTVAYKKGEKIALKVNMNNDRRDYQDTAWINSSPHLVKAVIASLLKNTSIAQADIILFDSSRYFTPHFYNCVHHAYPEVVMVDGYGGLPGRLKAEWVPNSISYAVPNKCGKAIAAAAVESDYLINLYIAKGHPVAGVTLSGKNHYGTIDGREHAMIKGFNTGYNQYNPIVEVMGHKDLGQKSLLNVCDMLYGCYHSDSIPIKWNMAPFNGNWPNSLLVSMDPVANDSVATDFLTAEFDGRTDIPKGVNTGFKVDMRNCDGVLHEAALADNPPSGSVYAPNSDGKRLSSLGVHEHWNNPSEKKYTRNLGTGNGIELVLIT
jgi:hypothetical protein